MSASDKTIDASFLSRWSRRKIEAKAEVPSGKDARIQESSTDAASGTKVPETPLSARTLPSEAQAGKELPSIDSLTHEADFSPFMAKDVDPGMRNQAMKKLFADPHYQFEQMDKLDIYLDDYSKSDPIPPDMLRMMYQSKSLGLFDHEKEPGESVAGNDGAGEAVETDVNTAALKDSPGGPPAADMSGEPDTDVDELDDGDPQEVGASASTGESPTTVLGQPFGPRRQQ